MDACVTVQQMALAWMQGIFQSSQTYHISFSDGQEETL